MGEPEQFITIELTSSYGVQITIRSDNPDMSASDFVDTLVKPAMIAYGFSPDTVNALFAEE